MCKREICVFERTISTWAVSPTDPIGNSSPHIPTTSPRQLCKDDWDCGPSQICEREKCVNEATVLPETDKTTGFTEESGTGKTTEIPNTSCQTDNDCNDGKICMEGSCEKELDGISINRDIVIHYVPYLLNSLPYVTLHL